MDGSAGAFLFWLCGAQGADLRRGQALTRPLRFVRVATALWGLQRRLLVKCVIDVCYETPLRKRNGLTGEIPDCFIRSALIADINIGVPAECVRGRPFFHSPLTAPEAGGEMIFRHPSKSLQLSLGGIETLFKEKRDFLFSFLNEIDRPESVRAYCKPVSEAYQSKHKKLTLEIVEC